VARLSHAASCLRIDHPTFPILDRELTLIYAICSCCGAICIRECTFSAKIGARWDKQEKANVRCGAWTGLDWTGDDRLCKSIGLDFLLSYTNGSDPCYDSDYRFGHFQHPEGMDSCEPARMDTRTFVQNSSLYRAGDPRSIPHRGSVISPDETCEMRLSTQEGKLREFKELMHR